MRVIATAGHVDHGKSTLVWALTGTDPDRWAEEKARGLTIDLGFAWCALPSGEEIGFVDVPGHGRFVKNMLAGVGAVDACMFVVAATEGWKAQSEEHLRILELLGISHGLVALTKVGLVDDEWRELAEMEVRDHVAGTFLADAEIIAVDVPAGVGLDVLGSALDRLVAATPAALDRGWPRLWVDRSFPVKGAGTVVTGTLVGGALAVDDAVVVEPGGREARVRGLHSHNRPLTTAAPGRRLAVNLSGISHDQVARGQAVVRPDQWHRCRVFDAAFTAIDGLDHPVTAKGAFTAHVGSGEFPVRIRLLGGVAEVAPGATAGVRVWLPAGVRLPLLPGDRYVLREAGRVETVGGGEVLDVEPVLPAARARPSRSVDRVVAERSWIDAVDLTRLTGEARAPSVGRWVVDPAALAATTAEIVELCRAAGRDGVELATFDARRRAIVAAGVPGLVVRGERVYDETAASDELSAAAQAVLADLETSPWAPPDLAIDRRGALRELERQGLVIQAGPIWFAASAVEAAVARIADLLAASPGGFTVSAAREALGITRKHAVPLLEHLDAAGITRRRGDVRIAGPRLGVVPMAHRR